VARVVIFTRLVARERRFDELHAVLEELTTASRAEPGCEVFAVHAARDEAGVLLGYEVFRDDAALAEHRASEAVARARGRLDGLLVEPPTITYALD
jgi:quinol monooxygenase YgiN